MSRFRPFPRFSLPFLLAFSLATGAVAAEVQSLTLSQAVQLARQRNPDLLKEENQVAAAEAALRLRQAALQPTLDFNLSASERFTEPSGLVSGTSDTVAAAVNSSLNLYRGGADLAAQRSAAAALAAARYTLRRREQDLLLTISSAFMQALTDRDLIAVEAENVEANRQLEERIAALVKAGVSPVSDLYQQQAATAQSRLNLLSAERNALVSRMQLLQTIGIMPDVEVELKGPARPQLFLAAATTPTSSGVRPDLLATVETQAATQARLEQAQAGRWPTLDLNAALGSNYNSNSGGNFSGQFGDDNPFASIGVALNLPLFDRGQNRFSVANARIDAANAHLDAEKLKLAVTGDIAQAEAELRTVRQQLAVTASQLQAAQEAWAAQAERYRVGASKLIEVTQARTALVTAQNDEIKAHYALLTRSMALLQARGDDAAMQALLNEWEKQQ
jgi:outer membrane protein